MLLHTYTHKNKKKGKSPKIIKGKTKVSHSPPNATQTKAKVRHWHVLCCPQRGHRLVEHGPDISGRDLGASDLVLISARLSL